MHISIIEPLETGHRQRYVAALAEAIPAEWSATYPAWFRPTQGDEGVRRVPRDGSPHAVVTLDSHRLLRRPRLPHRRAGWVAIDMLSRPAMLHPSFTGAGPMEKMKALADLALHWRASRFADVAIVYSNPLAHAVARSFGVHRAHVVPEPLERLPTRGLRRPPEFTSASQVGDERTPSPRWIVVCGYLDHRKGIDLLVRALERKVSRAAHIGLIVAGETRPDYREELASLLKGTSFPLIRIDRHLEQLELGWLLASADVVALPYRRHPGSSGLLGSVIDAWPNRAVVVSDFGWLGYVARRSGCLTFRDGSAEALAHAILTAIDAPSPPLVMPPGVWTDPREFARGIVHLAERAIRRRSVNGGFRSSV